MFNQFQEIVENTTYAGIQHFPNISQPIYLQCIIFFFWRQLCYRRVSLVAQMVENLPAMWETQVWSLSQENALEKDMATHSSILAWRIPWTEETGVLQSMRSQTVGLNWATNTSVIERIAKNHFYWAGWGRGGDHLLITKELGQAINVYRFLTMQWNF